MNNRERSAESRRRDTVATRRAAERRQRERDAPLLCKEAPGLQGLSMAVTESGQGPGIPETPYVRRFSLSTAPALFLFACGERLCEGGGYDLSQEVMEALRSRRSHLRGQRTCPGTVGAGPCTRKIHFEVTATFDEVAEALNSLC